MQAPGKSLCLGCQLSLAKRGCWDVRRGLCRFLYVYTYRRTSLHQFFGVIFAPDWSVPLRASPSEILVSERQFIRFWRCSSVLETKCCVSVGVDNLSEGLVWLLEKLLHYLWEYCLLSKERNPFRMNPQNFSFPGVWGDSWPRSLRCAAVSARTLFMPCICRLASIMMLNWALFAVFWLGIRHWLSGG